MYECWDSHPGNTTNIYLNSSSGLGLRISVKANQVSNYIRVFLGLIQAVKNLIPSDFEFADRSYDAGQYQYLIDGNFEPKQIPGVHLGSFTKMTNYENNWAVFFNSESKTVLKLKLNRN